jgi:hypothetical protein
MHARGGANSWVNLVTACMACNQRKGDKSLAQLGWRLPRAPREPTPQEVGIIAGISKVCLVCLRVCVTVCVCVRVCVCARTHGVAALPRQRRLAAALQASGRRVSHRQ